MAFAKLYETEKYGQILVMKDHAGNEGPELAFYFKPEHEDLSVCAVRIGFPDTEKGHDSCDKLFDQIDQEKAEAAVDSATKDISDFIPK